MMKLESKPASKLGRGLAGVVAALVISMGAAHAQTNVMPAARQHVKIVNGQGVKYTSKLQKVIELNFTFGYHHNASKPLIAATLTRVATDYAINGVPAFTVQSHIGPGSGSNSGLPTPDFNLA